MENWWSWVACKMKKRSVRIKVDVAFYMGMGIVCVAYILPEMPTWAGICCAVLLLAIARVMIWYLVRHEPKD